MTRLQVYAAICAVWLDGTGHGPFIPAKRYPTRDLRRFLVRPRYHRAYFAWRDLTADGDRLPRLIRRRA